MITEWKRVVLQNKLGQEEQLLEAQAKILSIPVVRTGTKQIERKRFLLTTEDLVAGSVPFMIQAMHQLKIPVPVEDSYPDSLSNFMGREYMRVRSLHEALEAIDWQEKPRFIKPFNSWKRFTGFVQYPGIPDYRLGGVSRKLPVWAVEPISIVSEWRAYVAHGVILAVKHYDGDYEKAPAPYVMIHAVRSYTKSGFAPDGYAIDFLVDNQDRTLLLEVNGGFSVGAYDDQAGDLQPKHYWRMISSYWKQLVQKGELT